jgi:intergrase/recombinase
MKREIDKSVKEKNEDEFLSELLVAYKKWKGKGEDEYAQAYRVLLNKFTQIDNEQ